MAHVAGMMQVDALPDDLRKTARDFSLRRRRSESRGRESWYCLGEFKRGVEGKNGQFARKGGTKISCQCLHYLVAIAPE